MGYLKLLTVLDRTVVPTESTEGLPGLKEAWAGDHIRDEGSSNQSIYESTSRRSEGK